MSYKVFDVIVPENVKLQNQDDKHVVKVKEIISDWFPAYKGARIAWMAARQGTHFALVSAIIELRTAPPENFNALEIDTPSVFAGQRWIAADLKSLKIFVNNALLGRLDIQRSKLELIQDQGSNGQRLQGQLYLNNETASTTPILSVVGGQHYRTLDEADAAFELRADEIPFSDAADLKQTLGLHQPRADLAKIDIVAMPVVTCDVELPDSSIVNIQCHVPDELDRTRIRVGLIEGSEENGTRRTSLAGSDLDWRTRVGALTATITRNVLHESLLQCYVSYVGVPVQERLISSGPTAARGQGYALWTCADSDLTELRACLFPEAENYENKTALRFEDAVAALFSMLGFSCLSIPRNRQERSPDIVATLPDGRALLIECTLETLTNKGKLSKLVNNSERFRAALAKTGQTAPQLMRVIASSRPRAGLEVDLTELKKHGVVGLCREDLEYLVEKAKKGTPTAEIHDEIAQQLSTRDVD